MQCLPQLVGVYGGGRMGAGIAHAFLVQGSQVVVVERDDEAAALAHERVAAGLDTAVRRGDLDAVAPVLGRLAVSSEPSALGPCELVIEAVPEDPALKAEVLRVIEQVAPTAVCATNTSSVSIDALAKQLEHPGQFLGLHFFNPVPASELVEIVVGSATSEVLVARAQQWVLALGKQPITVADSPGFASSRLGVALALEAIRMVEEGVASASDIDCAMTLGYRHPMGPLRTTDIVGLDVRLAIGEHLARELGERFEPPALLRSLVASGRLGRKTGEGFYTWPATS